MRILFICGAVEPGRDGVGDYTKKLAIEILKKGFEVSILALHDNFTSKLESYIEPAGDFFLPILRIPSALDETARYKSVRQWVLDFHPTWISLQFVPFSFHPKGIPINLFKHLKGIKNGLGLHIMFHELWVGIHGKEPFKMRLLGALQKYLIKNFIKSIKPDAITTSINIYKKSLPDFQIKILPLFGNIDIAAGVNKIKKTDSELKAVHFGTFTGAQGDLEKQLKYLTEAAKLQKKLPKLVIMGGGGPFKNQSMLLAKKILGKEQVTDLGLLPAKEISEQLLNADLGISRADSVMVGKSGSSIAMIEHGLPILIRGAREKVKMVEQTIPELENKLIFPDDDPKDILLKDLPSPLQERVATMFLEILHKKSN